MPANTNHIAGTTVLSSLSLLGTLSASTITAPALVVGGGLPIAKVSGSTAVSIVAMTLLANRSQTTNAALSGATPGDLVMINPPASGYSNGVVAQGYISAADVLTVNFSNVSGATAVQAAASYIVGYIRF